MSDPIEARVLAHCERLGFPFERIEIDPDLADTAQFCERYGFRLEESGNTILVASKKEPKAYCACVIQASARLDVNRTVRKLMGAKKASFANADETRERTGMMIGGVTPFALPEGMPIYVDGNLMAEEFVIVGGGSRSSKIKVSPRALEVLPEARVISELAMGPRGQGASD